MNLLVGLGNPGDKYKLTRHNIGFMLVDLLIDKLNPTKVSKSSFKGELYKAGNILLLKPQTFMNLSGESVTAVNNFYKCNDIIVLHDDLDLKFGGLKFKIGGSSGGHNGLKSIDSHIGNEYKRVRLGIGKPELKHQVVNHVLEDFKQEEFAKMDEFLEKASEASMQMLKDDNINNIASKYSQKQIII
jgi:PTH1 family peptidyl-tRNA hydrolase